MQDVSVTCYFGDALQPGDRERYSHSQVGPYQQQTVTNQQAAHRHSLAPYRKGRNISLVTPK